MGGPFDTAHGWHMTDGRRLCDGWSYESKILVAMRGKMKPGVKSAANMTSSRVAEFDLFLKSRLGVTQVNKWY